MKFLVDECTGPAVAEWLRNQNHEVFSIFEEARGMMMISSKRHMKKIGF